MTISYPPTSMPGGPPTVGSWSPPPAWQAPWPPFTRTLAEMCNHCWCERSVMKSDHAQCCKCSDTMHDQFLATPRKDDV